MKQIRLFALLLALLFLLASCIAGNFPQSESSADTSSQIELSHETSVPESSADISSENETSATEPSEVESSSADDSSANEPDSRIYFDNVTYKRPDFEAIRAKGDDVMELIANNAEFETVADEFDEYCVLSDNIETAEAHLSILRSLSPTDSFVSNEALAVSEGKTSENARYLAMIIAFAKAYPDDFYKEYGGTEEEIKALGERLEFMDEEYEALMLRRTDIINRYTATRAEENSDDIAAELYIQLIEVGNAIADKAGCESFADYCYKYEFERDYVPSDSAELCDAIKLFANSAISDITGAFTQSDAVLWSKAYTDKKLSGNESSLCADHFAAIGEMEKAYADMIEYGYIHIGNDPGVEQICYTTYLPSYDIPYVYIYERDGYSGLLSFIHEFGHYYALYMNGADATNCIDICEIQSQANEWLFLNSFDYYEDETIKAIIKYQLYESLWTLQSGCVLDEFQRLAYESECKTADELDKLYYDVLDSYGITGGYLDWRDVPHSYISPFYYISYAVSLIPALEIYFNCLDDCDKAIELYERISVIDNDVSFLEALDECGLSNPFDTQTIYTILRRAESVVGAEYSWDHDFE